MRGYGTKVISLLLPIFVVTGCSTASHSPSASNTTETFSREPAAAPAIDFGLTQTAVEVHRQNLQADPFRLKLLQHFWQASRKVLYDSKIDDVTKKQRVAALYDVYSSLTRNQNMRFWIGREPSAVEARFMQLDTLRAKLDPAAKIPVGMKLGAVVSNMRFVSNRIAESLNDMRGDLGAGVDPQLESAITLFRPIPGRIKAYSFRLTQVDAIMKDFTAIRTSSAWSQLQAAAKALRPPIGQSTDIRGLDFETENAVGAKAGPVALDVLFTMLGRVPASTESIAEMPNVDLAPAPAAWTAKRQPAAVAKPKKIYPNTILVGLIPGEYMNADKNSYVLGYVEITNRVITAMAPLAKGAIPGFFAQNSSKKNVIVLKNRNEDDYDVIYPGLIDLHDHTKQNVLPVWGLAKGQFENRFEWRDWDDYTKSVSQNMNPWIQFGTPIECAAFRWSELQSMVVGTTFLQGPSSCVGSFAIRRVEDKDSYVSKKTAVQAPTDIITPNDFTFVWQTLGPIIRTGKTYEEALAQVVNQYCPALNGRITKDNVNTKDGLAILSNQDTLKASCPETPEKPLPAKFIRYVYWMHATIAGKKKYLADARHSAVIAHLAEGRRSDRYNMKEYEVLKLLGLDQPNMVFVHGVGVQAAQMPELKAKNIGLVWSPFSNLILYGETLDVKAAVQAGVTVALGSDWLPTGTKGPLEEVKVAANYVDKDINREGLKAVFTDEVLYRMLSENPAKLINHWDNVPGVEAGVGRIAIGSMGTLIVTSRLDANPFTNLVRKVTEKDVNLVVIDGEPIYGNTDYLAQSQTQFEPISELDTTVKDVSMALAPPAEERTPEETAKFLNDLSISLKTWQIPVASRCGFSKPKGLALQDSQEASVLQYATDTGLNLDRFTDIQKLLAANVLTQPLNKISKEGDPKFATPYFPSLYTCNDEAHGVRTSRLLRAEGGDDWSAAQAERAKNRTGLGRVPDNLAELYK